MTNTDLATCTDCGTPLVLVADEFLLGVLKCPVCDVNAVEMEEETHAVQ